MEVVYRGSFGLHDFVQEFRSSLCDQPGANAEKSQIEPGDEMK